MRRVLVTGANKGIGKALVAAILEQGEDTYALLGSRDKGRGEDAKESLVSTHPEWAERIMVLPLDVTNDESVSQAATVIQTKFTEEKPLYGVINNAGIGFGDFALQRVLDVNVYGIHRVSQACLPLIQEGGRIVNITSASGPIFVSKCSQEQQAFFLNQEITWPQLSAFMEQCISLEGADAFAAKGLSDGSSYGLSKACANSYTILLAREASHLLVNACTPGFIETDLTKHYATSSGQSPQELGMKSPAEGTRSAIFLMFDEVNASGNYYGSDAQRSPLDRYRGPGDPPYTGN